MCHTVKRNLPICKMRKEGDDPTDSFVSSVPGLILQSTSNLLNAKYTAGTVFVDHESGLCYKQKQLDQNSDADIEAKESWEHILATHNKTVKAYHADNIIIYFSKIYCELRRFKSRHYFLRCWCTFSNWHCGKHDQDTRLTEKLRTHQEIDTSAKLFQEMWLGRHGNELGQWTMPARHEEIFIVGFAKPKIRIISKTRKI